MAVATVVTNKGKAMLADRLRATPGTYTNPPKYCAMGTGGGARTAAATDTALTTEVETRTSGTESVVTITVTNDTYQVVGTIVATATRTINEFGLFDASSVGNMGFSATHANVGLNSGDGIQYTAQIQIT